MRLLRAAVPALLAASMLGGLPAAHASGCGSTTDTPGDMPDKALDVVSATVTPTKKTVVVTLVVGQTDTKSDPATAAGGVSYYVEFNVGKTQYKLWRHVNVSGPEAFGGSNGVKPAHALTATAITWTVPRAAYPGIKRASDACAMTAYSYVQNTYKADVTN
jgi:hypothetical protein